LRADALNRQPEEFVFQSPATEGAIVVLPHGTYRYDLIGTRSVKRYVSKHIVSWYHYILDDLHCDIDNGDVRVVIGCDKTDQWGVATFSNCSETIELNFQPRMGSTGPYKWDYNTGSIDARSGPSLVSTDDRDTVLSDNSDIDADGQDQPKNQPNQCVFLRSINATLPDDIWKKVEHQSLQKSLLDYKDASAFKSGPNVLAPMVRPAVRKHIWMLLLKLNINDRCHIRRL